MGLFRSRTEPQVIPRGSTIVQGQRASDDALIAGFDAEAAEWADWLMPYIIEGLEMIRTGRYGSIRTKRHKRTVYGVLASSQCVVIDLYSYHGGGRVEAHLSRRFSGSGCQVTGQPMCMSHRGDHYREDCTPDHFQPGYYTIFIQPLMATNLRKR